MNDSVTPSKRTIRILSGVTVISSILILFLLLDRSKIKSDSDSWKSIATVEARQAKIWRNQNNLSQAQARAVVANSKTIEAHYGEEIKSLQKQIQGLKRNASNAHSLVTVSSKTDLEVNTVVRDTVVTSNSEQPTTKRVASYRDDWNNHTVIFGEDSAEWSLHSRDSLVIASYWKRPVFWKNKILYVEAVTFNPSTTFTGLRQIAIKPTVDRFVLGPFIGIDFRGRPTVGVGLTYKLYAF